MFDTIIDFLSYGCGTYLLESEIADHEKTCQYRPIKCPLGQNCTWTGAPCQVGEHCMTKHNKEDLGKKIRIVLTNTSNVSFYLKKMIKSIKCLWNAIWA